MSFILASGSAIRRTLLANAGLSFEAVPAGIDERAAEAPLLLAGIAPADLAVALAGAKALAVSECRPNDLVIGADQVLEFDGERLIKPSDTEAARRQLLRLSGRTHRLIAGLVAARGGETVWSHREKASLTMRPLTPAAIETYLAEAGTAVLDSVGAYQLEGPGINLFERIDGDYFTILGLPMLPLLALLRRESVIG